MEHLDSIWHPFTQYTEDCEIKPIRIDRAKGCYLYSGKRKILDAISSWWVNLHGHSHPHIHKAIALQIKKLDHVLFAGFTHEPAEKLAVSLSKILPGSLHRFFFSDNGSTSVEVAIKMAIQYFQNIGEERHGIYSFEHAYHGDTFGAMSVAQEGIFTNPFREYLFSAKRMPSPIPENAERIEKYLQENSFEKSVALVYEPLVQGAGGMLMHDPQILEKVLEKFREAGALLVADEVMTGFGRTGRLFASDVCKTKPDILCLSKGLTGGWMPLGVTACSDKVFAAFMHNSVEKTFWHGHSYTAYPTACIAAVANIELLMEEKSQKARRKISEMNQEFVNTLESHEMLKNVRSCGTILAADVWSKNPTSYQNQLRHNLYKHFLSRNVLIRPLGNTIYIMPPYCITEAELHKLFQIILQVAEEIS